MSILLKKLHCVVPNLWIQGRFRTPITSVVSFVKTEPSGILSSEISSSRMHLAISEMCGTRSGSGLSYF